MVLAIAVIAAIFFFIGTKVGAARMAPRLGYESLGPAELSWVIEGISEQIGKLYDDLTYAQALQRSFLDESSG